MKPENCLVDAQGYPKLVDFGFSKIIEKKSYTLCGTPEYLAPELVYGRGHDKSVDYWAFGILIYELTVGYSPFCDPSLDQTIICRNIVSGKLSFPSQGFGKKGVYDPKCKDIVKKLLVRDSKLRLGNLQGGVDDIFHEHWFSDFKYEKMMDKTIKAPWVPAIKNPEDMSHFDGIDDHAGDGAPYTDTSGWENEF
jgi:serine/threonine protein kinase